MSRPFISETGKRCAQPASRAAHSRCSISSGCHCTYFYHDHYHALGPRSHRDRIKSQDWKVLMGSCGEPAATAQPAPSSSPLLTLQGRRWSRALGWADAIPSGLGDPQFVPPALTHVPPALTHISPAPSLRRGGGIHLSSPVENGITFLELPQCPLPSSHSSHWEPCPPSVSPL